MSFPFEKLDVYQRSLDFVEQTELIIKKFEGKASRTLVDQLSRASLSIPLNIAEGTVVGISRISETSFG